MKIQNPFRLGLFGGLGVLVAILIGQSITSLGTILTYVGTALFLALGIDPAVSWLERHRLPRWAAIVLVFLGVLLVFGGLVTAIIPVVVDQVGKLIGQIPDLIDLVRNQSVIEDWWRDTIPWIPYETAWKNVTDFVNANVGNITSGLFTGVATIAQGAFGAFIVLTLTLYFVSSLATIKRALYQLVPATKRETFIDLSEQISTSVGRYVAGQAAMGVSNGIASFIVLNIIGLIFTWTGVESGTIDYAVLYAFLAMMFSLVPLVGTISGAVVITLAVWAFDGFPAVLVVGLWYLVYMQLEAYVLGPAVMNRAVKVPGVVVVVAALAGGTLLGVLGALIAIPVAAAILLIVKQVVVPRQNAL